MFCLVSIRSIFLCFSRLSTAQLPGQYALFIKEKVMSLLISSGKGFHILNERKPDSICPTDAPLNLPMSAPMTVEKVSPWTRTMSLLMLALGISFFALKNGF